MVGAWVGAWGLRVGWLSPHSFCLKLPTTQSQAEPMNLLIRNVRVPGCRNDYNAVSKHLPSVTFIRL